jgi:hypothetical protein
MFRRVDVIVRLLIVAALLTASVGHASTCDMLSYAIDDAETQLRRATRSADLDDARSYARRAKSALEDASLAAMDCECVQAYSEFDAAATDARRARDAADADELIYELKRTIRSYNDGIDALQMCAAE